MKLQYFHGSFRKTQNSFSHSSIMKNIVVVLAWSRFPVKLICWFTLGSALSACWSSNVYQNRDHILDQLCSFECYHMLSYHFLLADQRLLAQRS